MYKILKLTVSLSPFHLYAHPQPLTQHNYLWLPEMLSWLHSFKLPAFLTYRITTLFASPSKHILSDSSPQILALNILLCYYVNICSLHTCAFQTCTTTILKLHSFVAFSICYFNISLVLLTHFLNINQTSPIYGAYSKHFEYWHPIK